MADWLAGGEAPDGFTIDQDCELRSVAEDKAAVRYARHPLEGDDVKGHLEAGKLPTRLALTFDDRISFVLTEKLEIKRLDFLDIVRDQVGEADKDDAEALFNAEFALMTGELAHLLPAVVVALGGELAGARGGNGGSERRAAAPAEGNGRRKPGPRRPSPRTIRRSERSQRLAGFARAGLLHRDLRRSHGTAPEERWIL
jgi:recombination associated protein RdgC